MKRSYGEQATCVKCQQDIEWTGKRDGWRDRGGNRQCVPFTKKGEIIKPKGNHRPIRKGEWL